MLLPNLLNATGIKVTVKGFTGRAIVKSPQSQKVHSSANVRSLDMQVRLYSDSPPQLQAVSASANPKILTLVSEVHNAHMNVAEISTAKITACELSGG